MRLRSSVNSSFKCSPASYCGVVVAMMAAVRSLIPPISRLASVSVAFGVVFITLHVTPNPFLPCIG